MNSTQIRAQILSLRIELQTAAGERATKIREELAALRVKLNG